MSRRKRIPKFTTIAQFLEDFVNGAITKEDAQNILRGVEQGIGLEKRDKELAEAMRKAPESMEGDPLYLKGFNEAVWIGYLACKSDVENGIPLSASEEEMATRMETNERPQGSN